MKIFGSLIWQRRPRVCLKVPLAMSRQAPAPLRMRDLLQHLRALGDADDHDNNGAQDSGLGRTMLHTFPTATSTQTPVSFRVTPRSGRKRRTPNSKSHLFKSPRDVSSNSILRECRESHKKFRTPLFQSKQNDSSFREDQNASHAKDSSFRDAEIVPRARENQNASHVKDSSFRDGEIVPQAKGNQNASHVKDSTFKDGKSVARAIENQNASRVKDSSFKDGENVSRAKDTPFKENRDVLQTKDSFFKENQNVFHAKDSSFKENHKQNVPQAKDTPFKENQNVLQAKDSFFKENQNVFQAKDSSFKENLKQNDPQAKDTPFKENQNVLQAKESFFKENQNVFQAKDSYFKENLTQNDPQAKDTPLKENQNVLQAKDSFFKENQNVFQAKDTPFKEIQNDFQAKESSFKDNPKQNAPQAKESSFKDNQNVPQLSKDAPFKENRIVSLSPDEPAPPPPKVHPPDPPPPRPPTVTRQFGTITIKGKPYTVLGKLGSGGSSDVYKVMDPETSSLYAIKCVNLAVDPATARSYINEIQLLQKLQGSDRVITMHNYEYVKHKQRLFVLLEMGDVDLSSLLKFYKSKKRSLPFPILIGYWTEMLTAVDHIHKNGIIHSDLKPANFLLVHGRLKLIDFGIASSLTADATSIVMDSTKGTFNYISPEAVTMQSNSSKAKISYRSDVWSLGCILYSMLYGHTPFSHITQLYARIAVLSNPQQKIEYPPIKDVPPVLMKALRWCLTFDVKKRPSVEELINLPYLNTVDESQHAIDLPCTIMMKIKSVLSEEEWSQVMKAFNRNT